MNSKPTRLPEGWSEILEAVQHRVEQTLVAAEARTEALTHSTCAQRVLDRQQETAQLEACLQGLSKQLESAELLVHEVDQSLQAGEQLLQQQIVLCGSVGSRLAAWMGRAIG